MFFIFCFNHTATPDIYTLSLRDALPICGACSLDRSAVSVTAVRPAPGVDERPGERGDRERPEPIDDHALHPVDDQTDRKSTRLNSSHANISYAVFCLKQKLETTNKKTIR